MAVADDFYDPCAEGEPGVVDLGYGVRIKLTGVYGDETGAKIGLIESHPRGPLDTMADEHRVSPPDRCSGGITFDVPEAAHLPGAKWALHSLDPLHVEPSLLCRSCGHHGFIRGGEWVPV